MQSASPNLSLLMPCRSATPHLWQLQASLLFSKKAGRLLPSLPTAWLPLLQVPCQSLSLLQVFVQMPLPSEAFPAWHFQRSTCLSLYSLSSFLMLIYPHNALSFSKIICLFGLLCLSLYSRSQWGQRCAFVLFCVVAPSSWKTDWHMVGPQNIPVKIN